MANSSISRKKTQAYYIQVKTIDNSVTPINALATNEGEIFYTSNNQTYVFQEETYNNEIQKVITIKKVKPYIGKVTYIDGDIPNNALLDSTGATMVTADGAYIITSNAYSTSMVAGNSTALINFSKVAPYVYKVITLDGDTPDLALITSDGASLITSDGAYFLIA